ncbi:choline transporter-like protein 2 [Anneissia japonica]|uniref:choline transporter-like protein 2 n=1 Tax=Anneissia japonica TaxID=1529436 RepID=UPI0014257FBE|nr:choline transporter-like protein 2 [Anneissia japonica]
MGSNKVGPSEADASTSNSSKFGTPTKYDPNFKGPIQNRSCTDVICCIIFIAFIVGMFITGYIGWTNGDPRKLVYPTDSKGQICGHTEDVKNKPYLFFFDMLKCASASTSFQFQCPTTQICVESCPNVTFSPYTQLLNGALSADGSNVEWDKFICEYGFNPQTEFVTGSYTGLSGLFDMLDDEKCAPYYLESSAFADRCLPTILLEAVSTIGSVLDNVNGTLKTPTNSNITSSNVADLFGTAAKFFLELQSIGSVIFEDFVGSWWLILMFMGVSMLVALLYIILMRWFAGIIVWVMIFGTYALLGLGIYYCWKQYYELENIDGSDAAIAFTTDLSSYLRLQKTWLIFGITFCVILVILLIITLCLCNRIRIAIALIKEASRAITHMMSTLFWPIFPFLMQIAVVTLWAAIALYLASSGSATYITAGVPVDDVYNLTNGSSCTKETFETDYPNTTALCLFEHYGLENIFLYLQIYNLFGLFWLLAFVSALDQVCLAGAFASYYWSFSKPNDIPAFPVIKSFYRAIRYHLGSLAFGSFIIAVIQMIRVVLEYIDHKLKGYENAFVKFLIKCLKCCFWCLEKFMRFLNKNAYILIAVYGKNFCTSAKNAFFLLLRNIVRVAVINKITDFLLFFGVLTVTTAMSIGSFFYFTNNISWISDVLPVPELNYYWTPVIVIGIGSYVVAKVFFGVYDMAVDTLFLCFLEDLERHDGSAEKPYFMNKNLMDIVGKKNKFDDGKS